MMFYLRVFILGLLFMVLFLWVVAQLNPPEEVPAYVESPEERKHIEKRMRYHGLQWDIAILRQRDGGGWEFYRERDGKWCRL